MKHQQTQRFRDRKSECWNYPRISIYDDAWDGGPYLDFLDNEVENDAPLRIYLHVPFCKHFCTFCPYYKEPYNSLSRSERMAVLYAMADELEMYADRPNIGARKLSSIYFGGGDPAILSIDEHLVLWRALRSRFIWTDQVHISVEGTATSFLDEEKLQFFQQQGVERTSFGIQTFETGMRRQLNLRPTLMEIRTAIDRIAAAGIPDTSVDMIYNFPGQDETRLRTDLELVRELPVRYIDFYSLSLYPNTTYMRRVLEGVYGERPTAASEVRLCRIVHEEMSTDGYDQVSSVTFSRVTKEPHAGFDHTLRGYPTIAVGPSARSYIAGRNYRNHSSLEKYVGDVKAGHYPIEAAARFSAEELENWPYVFFPIRLRLAWDAVGQVRRHQETIDSLISDGYLKKTEDGVELSSEGRIWPGNIQRLFFSEIEREKERRMLFDSLRNGTNPYNEDRMGTLSLRPRGPVLSREPKG
jgi:oxygen-independent coproporphyrinogen III oxidase